MSPAAPIATRHVSGRRTVRYANWDDLLRDAEQLAHQPVRVLGNWSQGQIYRHLALTFDAMIDGFPVGLPAPLQWLARLLMKGRLTTQPMKPGFQIPRRGAPLAPTDEIATDDALQLLGNAVARIRGTDQRASHPGFGQITRGDWDAFQLRHCEMHMSFIVPVGEGGG